MIRTKLVVANTTKSLRCTVPAHIVRLLNLAEGDHLEWHVLAIKSQFKIELMPIRSSSKLMPHNV